MKRTTIIYIFIGMLIVVAAIFIASVFFMPKEPVKTDQLFEGRDFRRAPFELVDAYNICQYNTKKANQNRLLTSEMDELSTSYDPIKKIYLVVLNANIGSYDEVEEAQIYCTIDARSYELAYYKEVYKEKRSLIARGISFVTSFWQDEKEKK